jgi:hypothetical protein
MPVKENTINQFYPLLLTASELVYHPLGYQINNLRIDSEGQEYSACTFELSGLEIKYRHSKITPTKTGQFVTIWKRNEVGITAPFDDRDNFDLVVITAKNGNDFGQFFFPKAVLAKHKIITKDGVAGKRGIRVYPPWDIVTNKQAEKTQQWQIVYFLPISTHQDIDLTLAKKLINLIS